MTKLGLILISSLAAGVGLGGCQKDTKNVEEMGKDISAMKGDIAEIKDMLKSGAGRGAGAARPAAAQRPPRQGPDSNTVYSVPVHDYNPIKGNPKAPVTIVKGFEFACPFCKRVIPTMDQLLEDYGDDVRVVYKHYVVHPNTATEPALAACAAGLQGKYSEMEPLLWEKAFDKRDFARSNMEAIAKDAGLNMAKFKADMDGKCKEIVKKDQAELAAVGARGTPSFFINGRFLSGARPIDQFKTLVDEELKKAKERIGQGTSQDQYYAKWVVEKGEKGVK